MTEGPYGREAPQPGERRPPDSGPFVVLFVRNQEQRCDTVEPDTDRLGSIATVQRCALIQGINIADHLEPHTTSAFAYFIVPAYLREEAVAADQGPARTLDTTRGFAACNWKNGYNTPNNTLFVRGSNGELLIAIDIFPLGDDGELYNPLDTYTFTDVAVLIGRWTADGSDIRWDLGKRIRLGLDRGTRGLCEPSLVELDKPGTFMMVSRGSNSRRPDLPGYKWVSFSEDYCRTWSDPEPFTYADGTPVFSSATQSVLLRSRWNGRIYWIGNLHPTNPNGNFPRFPLVIGQVDERVRGLIRDSILVLDTRHEGETAQMQLSNFTVYEDRQTGNLIITLNRLDHGRGAPGVSWYVVGLPKG